MGKVPNLNRGGDVERHQNIETFLYHMVPEDMQGTILHPLNALKNTHPNLYLAKAAKYKGRLQVMEQFIPTLAAKWNDVLHFTAIHPKELKKALVEAGGKPREMKFYQIDPFLLDPKQTTIYLYQDKISEEKMRRENFAEYDPERMKEYSTIPQETKEYYKKMFGKGEKPLLFVGVPHILYKGSVDISGLPIITA